MAREKRIWTKEELTIAYYLAKWGLVGLQVSESDLVDVIKNTTKSSLRMQVANFRHILKIPGYQLTDASKAMYDVVESLKDHTITQVRIIALKLISESDIKASRIKRSNKKLMGGLDETNAKYRRKFENELKALRKYRNLTPLNK